jgi:hypothetical protein
MDSIRFTSRWNHRGKDCPDKTDLKCFTTIRLRNDHKYITGKDFKIIYKSGNTEIDKGEAKIYRIYNFFIDKLTDYIAMLDTGYNKEECTQIIKRMYSNSTPPIDWISQELSLILLVCNPVTEGK